MNGRNTTIDKITLEICSRELLALVVATGQDRWNWYALSENPNMVPSVIEANIHMPWVWANMASNVNVQIDFVRRHLDKPWSWTSLSQRLPVSDIFSNMDLPWCWQGLSANPAISSLHVRDYPNKPWNYTALNQQCKDIISTRYFQIIRWTALSENPTITLPYVLQKIDEPWNWYCLSANRGITFDDVVAHPELPWSWCGLSMNPNVTADIVRRNPAIDWDWQQLSQNDSVSLDLFADCPNRLYPAVNRLDRATIGQVAQFPALVHPWVCSSSNIQISELLSHPELGRYIEYASMNPNMMFADVYQRPAIWDFKLLSGNKFTRQRQEIRNRIVRLHMAAFRIQVYWRKFSSNPRFNVCGRVQCRLSLHIN